MVKLLRADLAHMWRTKSFWVCVMLSFALSAVNNITLNPGWKEHTARILLDGHSNSIILIAIFASLFLGTGYAHNTVRNKLIIGSGRADIYLSNLVTVILGGLIIALAYMLPSIFTVCVFGNEFGMNEKEFAFNALAIICALTAVCAIFTLLGTLITSKSANTAITITATFALCLGAAVILSLLQQPEFISNYEMTANGMTQTDPTPNPAYIPPGAKRNILTAVNDIIPTGQIIQMETGEPHNAELMPLYSFGVLSVTTAAGMLVFRRKDVK